ncbi:MAG: T9SS type A sorting domain-containing protein [Bacteroidales bacterium]|nr:T9SS type A sorting domain-containing protein [Bacteroidales bacterium]
MQTKLFAALFLLAICLSSVAQIVADTFNIPNYPIPEIYFTDEAPELPDNVWNHKLEYFPNSLFDQIDIPNCGQASGIYYCMTYMFNKAYQRSADSTNTFDPNFTFNFLSGGDGHFGVSTFDAWNIVKSQGNPSLDTYNAQEFPGYNAENDFRKTQWMNNYDNYLKSMSNKISEYYSIDLKTEEDLLLLKHFLHDGFKPAENGNIGIFYSDNSFFYGEDNYHLYCDTVLTSTQLCTKVYTSFIDGAEHSMTVVGYTKNEQIDFNNDGIISDTIDINNDGIIDHHDNESCFWIVVNSVGSNWSRDIFLLKYDMICNVWNSQIFFPIPEINYEPDLTFKINLEHPSRNSVKISAGVSSDPNASYPEYILDFPIFHFQGGHQALSGVDTIPNPEKLELGIDISDIKKFVVHSGICKIFLIIDNAGINDGKLLNASIINYSDQCPKETQLIEQEIAIPALDTKFFSTNLEISSDWDTNNISLLNEDNSITLSLANNQPNTKLNPSGGTGIYTFEIFDTCEYKYEYVTDEYEYRPSSNFTSAYESIIHLSNPIAFAGKDFHSISIQGNGRIYFDIEKAIASDLYPYQLSPTNYFEDLQLEFRANNNRKEMHYIYYEENDESVKVWLKPTLMTIEFFHKGEIHIIYSSTSVTTKYTAGIISNSKKYFYRTPNSEIDAELNSVHLIPQHTSRYFSISNNGEISCTPNTPLGNHDLIVIIKDSEGKKLIKNIRLTVINENIIGNLYPNPTKDILYCDIYNPIQQNTNVEIFTITGQCIYKESTLLPSGITEHNISTSKFGNGVYLLKITMGEKSQTQRFVVMR